MAELASKDPNPKGKFGQASPKTAKFGFSTGPVCDSPLNLSCPKCGSQKVWRNGKTCTMSDDKIQRLLCRSCGQRFSDPNDSQRAKKAHESIETVETQSLKSTDGIFSSSQIASGRRKTWSQNNNKLKFCREAKMANSNKKSSNTHYGLKSTDEAKQPSLEESNYYEDSQNAEQTSTTLNQ